ncbi:MAG: FmdB family transcriptional regulator, partial [Chloroflexi bacterium]|nr:FmdB family transcriptional regulator [Chloroflexota bacterium]
LHSIPIVFKGSGFYITDHGRGSSWNRHSESEATATKSQENKTEAKAETKTEAKD